MLTPRNVIYGFSKTTNPPKPKYLISLYRDENTEVIACFTTSRPRAGVPLEDIRHGSNKRDGKIISFVFLAHKAVGIKPNTSEAFSFPLQTTVRFSYCFQEADQSTILKNIENPEVVGVLDNNEYVDLIYAMYWSPDTPEVYKPFFEKVLEKSIS